LGPSVARPESNFIYLGVEHPNGVRELWLADARGAAPGQEASKTGSPGRIKEEPVGRLRLANSRIAVEIDQRTGGLRAVHDKDLDVRYDLRGSG
jgi:hypothetical protein